MFGWNPFKKPAPAPVAIEDGDGLELEIARARSGASGHDLRPLQRLIRDTTFLLPLREPPLQTDNGLVLLFQTFDAPDVLCAFSDADRLRDFLRSRPAPGAQSFQTGRALGELAEREDARQIVLNPNSPGEFSLSPMVFRALAHGFVLGHAPNDRLPNGELAIGKSVAGMPGMDALDAFRVSLGQFRAVEAWWATLFLPPDEIRFCLGVGAPANAFETLPEQLAGVWNGRWPLPTPLHVFALDGQNPARDAAFRACDRIL